MQEEIVEVDKKAKTLTTILHGKFVIEMLAIKQQIKQTMYAMEAICQILNTVEATPPN